MSKISKKIISTDAGVEPVAEQLSAVSIESVSKYFRRRSSKPNTYTTLKSRLFSGGLFSGDFTDSKFTALDRVKVEVPTGSSFGVVGRNGSGKSTLLKLIAGIYHPDEGRVQVRGRIAALIELGAGFHPEFSGRENIYLGGIMYGLTRKEIDKKFETIVEFAELGQFIDDPVRTYSSGMFMRLGFSLAIHTDPDILLIDEVLAVGDAGFVAKCRDKISEFKSKGKTLIFVTHDLDSVVRWCDTAIWIDKGVVAARGEPRVVIDKYLQRIGEGEQAALEKKNQVIDEEKVEDTAGDDETRWGSQDVRIDSVKMRAEGGEEKWLFNPEDSVCIEVSYTVHKPVGDLVFGVGILRVDGFSVHGTNTDIDGVKLEGLGQSSGKYVYRIERLGLVEDSYFLDVAAHSADGTPYDYHHRLHKFSVKSSTKSVGVYSPKRNWLFDCSSNEKGEL